MFSKRVVVWIAVLAVMAVLVPAHSEEEGGIFAWWTGMRMSGYMKSYDIDEATATKLKEIIVSSKEEQKTLTAGLNVLYAKLDLAVADKKSDEEIVGLIDQIKSKKTEIAAVEPAMFQKVQDLMGPQKTAKFILSQRGMFQRANTAIRRNSAEVTGRTDEPAPARPTAGSRTGY